MSAAPLDSESSQSSSGYEDGLGRRVLAFDRETGDMLERLVLRPELSAFEQALRDRMAIVSTLEDERFTRPRAIERAAGSPMSSTPAPTTASSRDSTRDSAYCSICCRRSRASMTPAWPTARSRR